MAEDYGVGGKFCGSVSEEVAEMGVICAVDPVAVGDLFAGDIAFVVRIGFVILEQYVVSRFQTLDK